MTRCVTGVPFDRILTQNSDKTQGVLELFDIITGKFEGFADAFVAGGVSIAAGHRRRLPARATAQPATKRR
jgi:hypothetical protein